MTYLPPTSNPRSTWHLATKRKRKTRSSKSTNRNTSTAGIVIILLLVGYFLLTGNDPLGLFDSVDPGPPAETGGSSDWWEVYFTNPQSDPNVDNLRGTVAEKLIENINAAQSTIHIASFEFDLPQVADALIAAQGRGVTVRWVTDDEHGIESDEDSGLELFSQLEAAGVRVKDDGREALMHDKFWIFDRQRVWTGSTNITENGVFRNNNNVLLLKSPRIAEMYEREFAEMWDDGAFGPTSPSDVGQQQTTVNGTPVLVLFGPEDDVGDKLTALLNEAQHSIRFMAFSFTYDDMGDAILRRAKANVDVQGIFEARGSETEFSELPKLFCAGLNMRQDGNPRILHHKTIVIDEQIVITGSYNFSNNANRSNDENLVIMTSRDLATHYLQEFDRRWAEAAHPETADMDCP
jgi:phosphatidylserine/phosphatidylglycerophosphate/cardiolipin synthase-like enzyme